MTLKQTFRNYPKAVMSIIGAMVVLGTVSGGALFVDDRYAQAADTKQTMQMLQVSIEKTNTRIDMGAMQQRINALEDQMWKIEDRCGTDNVMSMPIDNRQRYRKLAKERKELEDKLTAMQEAITAPTGMRIENKP